VLDGFDEQIHRLFVVRGRLPLKRYPFAPCRALDRTKLMIRAAFGHQRLDAACRQFELDGIAADEAEDATADLVTGIAKRFACLDTRNADQNFVKQGLHVFAIGGIRSEEHTSELQSRENLACRL